MIDPVDEGRQEPMTNAGQVVDAALEPGRLVPAYQPIVDLETDQVVGFEALARWPGDEGLNPGSVFAAAEATGRVSEVDWACRTAALRDSLAVDLPAGVSVFVNVEPATPGEAAPAGFTDVVDEAVGRLGVVIELTERALLEDPAGVLRTVDWARERGWQVAMDDVGAQAASLQLLPFVNPDVIKLDLSLTQADAGREQGPTMLAVWAQAEETGAALLAEGIETPAHLEHALALGARYGQGWALGMPGALAAPEDAGDAPVMAGVPCGLGDVVTPFDLVERSRRVRRGTKSQLLAMSHQLEDRAATPSQPSMLISTFQRSGHFTSGTARDYQQLAVDLPFVGAMGAGFDSEPAPGVRGANLDPADPLVGQWTVVVIGPHYAGALIARDCGDDVPDLERRFDYVLTHQRDIVLEAGRCLMRRIARRS